ncbi:membrane protein insertase YidC [Luteolibacter flavescens]|uniref:Membrane protein insertase YidC n=1 Tax=Luteolibacter flavescens TaxID=1859460 RepID=A0ABT3FTT8_9BACT|nr:membrane protein insertase YidC [Luteolibacter flavescens]MCW1886980.1 membrane protein insertase YidC [Luteolibacter flavescens]
MYDRKTWIVVIVCSLLLAVNIFYQQKNGQMLAEQKREQAAREAAAKPADAPATPADGSAPAATGDKPNSLVEAEPPAPSVVEQLVKMETPEAIYTFTSIGGGLKTAEFKNQTPGLEGPVLLNRHGSSPVGALADGPDRMETTAYEFVEADSMKFPNSEHYKSIVFRGKLSSGLWAKKTWSLRETGNEGDPFSLDFKLQLENGAQNNINLENYSLFLGVASPLDTVETAAQTGFVRVDDRSFSFTAATEFAGGWFKDERELITETMERGDIAGVANQFFATAMKPAEPGPAMIWAKVSNVNLKPGAKPLKAVRAGLQLPTVTLAPKDSRTMSYHVFAGPKQNRVLRKMGEDWGKLMNYGFFSPFSRFMSWSIFWVHSGMEKISSKWSWGLAVVALTILLRLAIWPLYNRSNRTMKRMAKLKPEMDKLKEKYPDDPQKMNTEMMGMYRKYGINPLGGCLPMLAQLPIFFGFYSMLLHAVEMRGQEFLWVKDLSQPDTVTHLMGLAINPLPIVMAITSFLQMAMMPNTGGDKTQMRIMKMMPFFFLIICYNFASALALYWTVSNVFSIAQTWISNRMPEPELKAKAGGGTGKSWVERMAEKQAEMERMRQARGRVVEPGTDDPNSSKKRPPRTGG